jgi:hypothetical protein
MLNNTYMHKPMKAHTKHQNTESGTAVEVLPKLVELLAALPTLEREKAISAAKILLADSTSSSTSEDHQRSHGDAGGESIDGFSGKAVSWTRKNGLSREQLDQLFSIEDNTFDVIAAKMPGRSKRQQTVEAYIMCGLKSFLQTGEPNFTDKEGRQLCQKVGCYDSPNHYNHIKAFGNRIGGSKDGGWKLTNPGLSEAARIVKELTPTSGSQG